MILLVVNVESLETRSNQLKYQEQKSRSPKITAICFFCMLTIQCCFFAAKTAIELEANVTLISTVFLRGCKKINYF